MKAFRSSEVTLIGSESFRDFDLASPARTRPRAVQ